MVKINENENIFCFVQLLRLLEYSLLQKYSEFRWEWEKEENISLWQKKMFIIKKKKDVSTITICVTNTIL